MQCVILFHIFVIQFTINTSVLEDLDHIRLLNCGGKEFGSDF